MIQKREAEARPPKAEAEHTAYRTSARPPRQRVDGILLLDKPAGLSSNAALQRSRRSLNALKAGHTGTLDPLASGLLPLCFGDATKFASLLLDAHKEYVATLRFGIATATGDAEGEVIAEAAVDATRDALLDTLANFVGESQQVPPRHAALKHEGRKYYDYARAGVDIPRPARTIHLDALELLSFEGEIAVVRVGCSKGTYVRALAEDIAHALGTVAHLSALRRTASGPFRIEQAVTLETLEGLPPPLRRARLLPVDSALHALPRIDLASIDALAILQGRAVTVASPGPQRMRAYDACGRFIGIVQAAGGILRASRMVDAALVVG